MKNKESKSLKMIRRTSNDIIQLFNELTTDLSHEYLYSKDKKDNDAIKRSLDIINDLKENFLNKSKEAMEIILDEENLRTGAEAKANSNWLQTDEKADDFIKNKPTIPTVNNDSDEAKDTSSYENKNDSIENPESKLPPTHIIKY